MSDNINLMSPEDIIDYIKENLRVELCKGHTLTKYNKNTGYPDVHVIPDTVKLYFGDELISEG